MASRADSTLHLFTSPPRCGNRLSGAPSNRDRNSSWAAGEPSIAGATHVGVVRRVNQDAFGRFDDPERGETLLVVADGLGGHRGGEVASRMAIELLGPLVCSGDDQPALRLTRAIEEANRQIHDAARVDYTLEGMGTTVVCLLLARCGQSYVAHVGDSRLYRLRAGGVEVMTEDHSLVATLVRQGVLSPEEARSDPRKNQILRALGVRKEIEVDVAPLEPQPGDTYLLCSDGLHGLVDDHAIRDVADAVPDPELAVSSLIDAANRAGGTDNVTCLLARFPERSGWRAWRERAVRMVETARSRLRSRRLP